MPSFDEKRRRLLVLGCGALAAACFSPSTSDDSSNVEGGDEDDGGDPSETDPCASTPGKIIGDETTFAEGSWTLVGEIIVAQDANGFYAYTAICTHQGCLIGKPASNGKTICPCHGSEFDGNGKVLVGPASSPLKHFAVAVCNGSVYVDNTTVVSATTRTPPV